jgi:hypothetical protein
VKTEALARARTRPRETHSRPGEKKATKKPREHALSLRSASFRCQEMPPTNALCMLDEEEDGGTAAVAAVCCGCGAAAAGRLGGASAVADFAPSWWTTGGAAGGGSGAGPGVSTDPLSAPRAAAAGASSAGGVIAFCLFVCLFVFFGTRAPPTPLAPSETNEKTKYQDDPSRRPPPGRRTVRCRGLCPAGRAPPGVRARLALFQILAGLVWLKLSAGAGSSRTRWQR